MGARFVRWQSGFAWANIARDLDPLARELLSLQYTGFPVFLQKPAHVLSLAAWSLPGWNETVAAISLSLVCSLVTILLTAELCRHWFDRSTALVAGAWLALQPYHIHYSRLALHEMTSMTMFLVAIYLRQKTSNRASPVRFALSGAFAMSAIGASYRYLPFVVLFLGWEIIALCWKRQVGIKLSVARWIATLAGAALVFTILNTAYHVCFAPQFLWSQPASYLAVLKMKFLGGESSFDLEYPFFYINMIRQFDGIAGVIIPVLGIGACLRIRSRHAVKLVTVFLLIFTLFSCTTTRVPRTITGLLPFMAMLASLAIVTGYRNLVTPCRSKTIRRVYCILVIGVFMLFIPKWNSIWQIRSAYPEIINWLKANNVETFYTTMQPVFAVELGRDAPQPVPSTLAQIQAAVEETGVRYLLVDWQKTLRYEQSIRTIEEACLPVFAMEHNPGLFFATLHENHLPVDVPLLQQDPSLGYVKVYDLYQVLPQLGRPLSSEGVLP